MADLMKLAIVVGHNSDSQGAVRTDTGESEFRFNSRLAEIIQTYARAYDGLDAKVFYRQAGGGYTREIRRVYAETDAWGADATVELHFNGAADSRATGTETLTSGTPASMRMAVEVNNAMVAALGLRDRGVKTRREGRGSGSLMSGSAPAILVEPFFGSSPSDCDAVKGSAQEEALARAILRGVTKANDLMPRKSLEGSRTLAAVDKSRKANKIGQAGAATTMATTILGSTPSLEDAIGIGQMLDGAMPWLAGAGVAIVIGAFIYKSWQDDKVEAARIDDMRKELR